LIERAADVRAREMPSGERRAIWGFTLALITPGFAHAASGDYLSARREITSLKQGFFIQRYVAGSSRAPIAESLRSAQQQLDTFMALSSMNRTFTTRAYALDFLRICHWTLVWSALLESDAILLPYL
jgi:hypothetical protein